MKKRIVRSDNAPAPIGPYSQAVSYGDLLFISGQIPLDPITGELVGGSIEAETKQVMENLKAILTTANMGFTNVLKTTIFLTSMSDFAKVNEVYGKYIDSTLAPARETVQVSGLPKGVNVEISMIAGMEDKLGR